jgi:hypothetical protein
MFLLDIIRQKLFKMTVFKVVALCKVYRRFRGAGDRSYGGGSSTSETSVNFYQTTRRNNLEDSHLDTYRRENLKFYKNY